MNTPRLLTLIRRCALHSLLTMVIVMGIAVPNVSADTVSLYPIKDNTLIQSTTGSKSNGSGFAIFSGRVGSSAGGTIRRAVMAFDLSIIPASSTIISVKLTVLLTDNNTGPQVHTLHRVLANWGEGASATDTGQGAPSQPNDATWIHRFYPTTFWTTAGGDYVATPSTSQSIGSDLIAYTFESSAGMVADVQFWLENPAGNFGWLIKGNETVIQTVKKFASRETPDPFSKPRLEIDYVPPPSCITDLNHDRATGVMDLLTVINSWGSCPQPCAPYCYCDLNSDCQVNAPDLLEVINHWGACD